MIYRYLLFSCLFIVQYNGFAQSKLHPYKNLTPLEEMRDLEYPFTVHYATIDSVTEIAYVDEGKSDTIILFIHGLGSYLPAWQHNISELSKHFRCIAIDLPGYGKSSKHPHSGMMTYYAQVLTQFMDQLNIEAAILAGHSMGGQIAIVTALYHPKRVKALILAAPAGFEVFNEGQKEWFREVMTLQSVKSTPVEAIQNNIAYNFYNMPKDADFMVRDRIAMRSAKDFEAYCYAIVRSVNGMVDEPVFDYLPDVKQKTLVLYGLQDNLIPNRYLNPGFTKDIAIQGTEQMPNAKLVLLEKTGHFLQFEQPKKFNEEVTEFVKGL